MVCLCMGVPVCVNVFLGSLLSNMFYSFLADFLILSYLNSFLTIRHIL